MDSRGVYEASKPAILTASHTYHRMHGLQQLQLFSTELYAARKQSQRTVSVDVNDHEQELKHLSQWVLTLGTCSLKP